MGKMAYGTGPVPFIHTSDISTGLKTDPKQCVSVELARVQAAQDAQVEDIFVVRDGALSERPAS